MTADQKVASADNFVPTQSTENKNIFVSVASDSTIPQAAADRAAAPEYNAPVAQ